MVTPQGISASYIRRAIVWIGIATILYLLLNGAQIFETALIVPNWTAAPPQSLYLFQGAYGLDFKTFWIAFHSLHEIAFILAIIFSWRIKWLRYWLLALFAVHLGVRIWTISYFAPTIVAFQQMAASQSIDPALVNKAGTWQMLNYIRVGIFMAVSFAFVPLLYRTINLQKEKGSDFIQK